MKINFKKCNIYPKVGLCVLASGVKRCIQFIMIPKQKKTIIVNQKYFEI